METVMETVTTKGTSVYENTAWSRATPLARATPWLRAAQHKISELARLAENWDSYGSRPIQSMAIEQASIAIEH